MGLSQGATSPEDAGPTYSLVPAHGFYNPGNVSISHTKYLYGSLTSVDMPDVQAAVVAQPTMVEGVVQVA
jgi:hypothetical protein